MSNPTPPGPKRLPSGAKLMRPSTNDFREMIGSLANSADLLDDDPERFLHEAVASIYAVLSFIQRDEGAAAAVMPGPLTYLASALTDLSMGAKPKSLIGPKKSLVGPETGGKPTNLASREVPHAYVAAAFDLLVTHGGSAQSSSQWIAQTCGKLGLKVGGKAITAKQVERWQRDLSREQTASRLSIELFKRLRSRDLRGQSAEHWALATLETAYRNYGTKKPGNPPSIRRG